MRSDKPNQRYMLRPEPLNAFEADRSKGRACPSCGQRESENEKLTWDYRTGRHVCVACIDAASVIL